MNDPELQKFLRRSRQIHQQNPMKLTPKIAFEDEKFQYYYDLDNRLRRAEKNYTPRPGYIRFKFLEKFYRFWQYRSQDGKNALIPLFLSAAWGYTIYFSSVSVSEWEVSIKEKAKLPEELTPENLEQHKKLKEEIEEWKKQKQNKAQAPQDPYQQFLQKQQQALSKQKEELDDHCEKCQLNYDAK